MESDATFIYLYFFDILCNNFIKRRVNLWKTRKDLWQFSSQRPCYSWRRDVTGAITAIGTTTIIVAIMAIMAIGASTIIVDSVNSMKLKWRRWQRDVLDWIDLLLKSRKSAMLPLHTSWNSAFKQIRGETKKPLIAHWLDECGCMNSFANLQFLKRSLTPYL